MPSSDAAAAVNSGQPCISGYSNFASGAASAATSASGKMSMSISVPVIVSVLVDVSTSVVTWVPVDVSLIDDYNFEEAMEDAYLQWEYYEDVYEVVDVEAAWYNGIVPIS